MNRKYVITASVIILSALILFYVFSSNDSSRKISFETEEVIAGDISSKVTANGRVEPLRRVEIRSNIQGTVREVTADINDEVEKGEVLAKLNDTLFETRLNEAESRYNKAKNELENKRDLLESDEVLFEKELISKQEYQESLSRYRTAVASFEEAKASLEIARTNMESTNIRAPIDGLILSRNINTGNVITPGDNSEPLFVIVSRLDKMHLVSDVGESDISEVEKGQKVIFRVSAYPDESFEGEVVEISNNPKTQNNIVRYEVISEIENRDRMLKPGMTAEVEILTSVKKDVIKVPTSALRIVIPGTEENDTDAKSRKENQSIWMIGANGELMKTIVSTGISDETHTEITEGNLKPGQQVVTGFSTNTADDSESLITLPQPKRF